jgi:hypothetical protein
MGIEFKGVAVLPVQGTGRSDDTPCRGFSPHAYCVDHRENKGLSHGEGPSPRSTRPGMQGMQNQGRKPVLALLLVKGILGLAVAGSLDRQASFAAEETRKSADSGTLVRRLPRPGTESKAIRRLPGIQQRPRVRQDVKQVGAVTPPTNGNTSSKIVLEFPPGVLPPPQPASSISQESMADQRRREMVDGCDFEKPMTVFAAKEDPMAMANAPSISELRSVALPPDVERRARGMLEDATELANRGALFAAHEEFIRVMRLVAQSLDAVLGRPFHAEALAAGLRALDEAQAFGMKGKHAEADIYLAGFIAGHQTPVLKSVDPSTLTPLLAMQRYYEYAYAQLTIAGNDERIASDALFALGRIEALMMEQQPDSSNGSSKAIALYQSALAVNGSNSRAANELGVLLARSGRLREARDIFAHAAQRQPIPMIEQNLRGVESQLAQESEFGGFVLPESTSAPIRPVTMNVPGDPVQELARNLHEVDPRTFNALPDPQASLPPMPNHELGSNQTMVPQNSPTAYFPPSPAPSPSLKQRLGTLFSP